MWYSYVSHIWVIPYIFHISEECFRVLNVVFLQLFLQEVHHL